MNPKTNIPKVDAYVADRIQSLPPALAAAIHDPKVSNWLTQTLQQFQLSDDQIEHIKNEVVLILLLLEPLEELQAVLVTECDVSLGQSFEITDRLNRDFFQPNIELLQHVPTEESLTPESLPTNTPLSAHPSVPPTEYATPTPIVPAPQTVATPTPPVPTAPTHQVHTPAPLVPPIIPTPPLSAPTPPTAPIAQAVPAAVPTPSPAPVPAPAAPPIGYAAAQSAPVSPTTAVPAAVPVAQPPQVGYAAPQPLTRDEVEASLAAKRTMASDIDHVQHPPVAPNTPITLPVENNAPIPQYATPLTGGDPHTQNS